MREENRQKFEELADLLDLLEACESAVMRGRALRAVTRYARCVEVRQYDCARRAAIWNITLIGPFFFVASRKAGEPFDWLGPVLLSTPCG
jgi:hypothetical protein